ncbi:hypothetical protein MSAN_01887200 [Mycena sanguinolenta]|uniref:Uncharacterized protein n=1 Tax=Mycena sanguinolenta TaxID=230812 RepID=A0A8H6XRA6_9AGAR|nr:hypothetical protein MSAN_01887200 [Mycena sanguinolenta]
MEHMGMIDGIHAIAKQDQSFPFRHSCILLPSSRRARRHPLSFSMASLAGRPPFATEPSSPQPRTRGPQQPPAKRTSAHDVYDNYLAPGEGAGNRNSGIDALGMGFMNSNMDDDSDDDDEEDMRRGGNSSVPSTPSKHAALAAATGVSPSKGEMPPPQYLNQQRGSPQAVSPPPRGPGSPGIAAPRPGYPTPIAALNQSANGSLARPAPAAAPGGRTPPSGGPPNLRIEPPAPGSPYGPGSPYADGTPSPSGSPHPLGAPLTPITPVFARPQRSNTTDSANSVTFSETKGLIMRGDGEGTMPRPRGQKGGDQFWRRFSMVAKDPDEKHPSRWLSKAQGSNNNFTRWVWIVGIILVVCAAGGIGLGVYLSEQANAHYRPDAIGGSADEGTASLPVTTSTSNGAKGAIATSSSPHVSPTNTVARREPEAFEYVTAAVGHGHGHASRKRHNVARLEAELL